jgi:hypothetical protein
MLLINVYHGDQILNTSIGVGYDICAACTFFADETINLCDLKKQIHAGLELLPIQFDIRISARINTVPAGSSVFLQFIWGYNSSVPNSSVSNTRV